MTALQTAIALARWPASWNMLRISASVDGIRVAPPMPSTARAAISSPGFWAYAAATDATPNASGAEHQQPTASDPVAERAHRDQQAGQHEAVDVEDPQLLGRGGRQVAADERDGEVQHRDVHRHQQQRQRQHRERDPLLAARPRWSATVSVVIVINLH